jgi:phospholipid-binding lipoprotein MlaA
MKNYKKQSVVGAQSVALFVAALGCLSLAGCATAQKNQADAKGAVAAQAGNGQDNYDDPLEGYNRVMFKINDTVDQAIMQPVAMSYRTVVPRPIRIGVRNFLHNLRTPVNAANNLLQGNIRGVATDLSRFAMNTTIGLGGLIDVAKDTGLRYKPEDFGQTLGVWGVGHGPYLVIPLLGPSSVRDATGLVVDSYADPVRLYLYTTHQETLYYIRAGLIGVDEREALLDAIYDLRKHSFDYYAATRSAYFQERDAMISNRRPGRPAPSADSIPNYGSDHP